MGWNAKLKVEESAVPVVATWSRLEGVYILNTSYGYYMVFGPYAQSLIG